MAGDDRDRDRLIEEHLPLVRSVARRFARRGEALDDLVQVGSIGLIKAVDRFDPASERTLEAVAAPMIEGEIRHHLRDRTPIVRVPRPLRELGARVRSAEGELTAADGRAPGIAALAEAVGASEADVSDAILARSAATSTQLGDVADEHAPAPEDRAALAMAWERLPERERTLLDLRYHEDLSQADIAKRVGLSQAHVSRLLARAVERLRAATGDDARPEPDDPRVEPLAAGDRGGAPTHSGRLLLRMPQSLHEELAHEAEREGVSLNTLIAGTLASSVGWRDATPDPDAAAYASAGSAAPPASARTRWPSIALWVNLVVVAIVAVVAVALLVMAATGG